MHCLLLSVIYFVFLCFSFCLLQNSQEGQLERNAAALSVAEALQFFASFLGCSGVAFNCKGEAISKFIIGALSKHQAAVLQTEFKEQQT